MGTRKNGACKSEQPDFKVEPDLDKDLGLNADSDKDLDSEPDIDLDEDLDIDLDLEDDSDAEPDIDDTVETGEANSNVGETSVEIDVEELCLCRRFGFYEFLKVGSRHELAPGRARVNR